MEIEIKEVFTADEKSHICKEVLSDMQRWHWIVSGLSNDSVNNYGIKVRAMPFYAAYADKKVIGFAAISSSTKEISIMGVVKAYRHQGVGEAMITHCEEYLEKSLKVVGVRVVPH